MTHEMELVIPTEILALRRLYYTLLKYPYSRNSSHNLQEKKYYLYTFNNQELQCYPCFYQSTADLETLIRSVTNQVTNTKLTQSLEFTQYHQQC